jgi:hypothetical protein
MSWSEIATRFMGCQPANSFVSVNGPSVTMIPPLKIPMHLRTCWVFGYLNDE